MCSKPIALVLYLVCLSASIKSNPLTGSEATIPRTEVLESVLINSAIPGNSSETTIKSNGTNICMTKGCVKASALVLDLIDENVDPCDNFCEFRLHHTYQSQIAFNAFFHKSFIFVLVFFSSSFTDEFACGKFLRNTFIPDDKIAMMSFVHVQDKVLGQLRTVLNERSMPNESKPFTLAKTFNTACMDEETLERKGW